MEIVKSIQEFGLLVKSVSETVENEVKKQQKSVFLSVFDASLAASLLGSALRGKRAVRGGDGVIRASE